MWSPWAKAAPFVQLPGATPPPAIDARPDTSELAAALAASAAGCAIVVSVPGPDAISLGLEFAKLGYRPVPLFNACSPRPRARLASTLLAVDTDAIVASLLAAADRLVLLNAGLAPNAPPAFLVDSRRSVPRVAIEPHVFDNRSVVFASDFPSAKFLRSHGITRALLIQDVAPEIGRDLLAALQPWRRDGLVVETVSTQNTPIPVAWPREGFLNEWRERWFSLFHLRRARDGGFGNFVPEASGG